MNNSLLESLRKRFREQNLQQMREDMRSESPESPQDLRQFADEIAAQEQKKKLQGLYNKYNDGLDPNRPFGPEDNKPTTQMDFEEMRRPLAALGDAPIPPKAMPPKAMPPKAMPPKAMPPKALPVQNALPKPMAPMMPPPGAPMPPPVPSPIPSPEYDFMGDIDKNKEEQSGYIDRLEDLANRDNKRMSMAAFAKSMAQVGNLYGQASDTSAVADAEKYADDVDLRKKKALSAALQERMKLGTNTTKDRIDIQKYLRDLQEKQKNRDDLAKTAKERLELDHSNSLAKLAQENKYKNAMLGTTNKFDLDKLRYQDELARRSKTHDTIMRLKEQDVKDQSLGEKSAQDQAHQIELQRLKDELNRGAKTHDSLLRLKELGVKDENLNQKAAQDRAHQLELQNLRNSGAENVGMIRAKTAENLAAQRQDSLQKKANTAQEAAFIRSVQKPNTNDTRLMEKINAFNEIKRMMTDENGNPKAKLTPFEANELATSAARFFSGGVPTDSQINHFMQKTFRGDVNKAKDYFLGSVSSSGRENQAHQMLKSLSKAVEGDISTLDKRHQAKMAPYKKIKETNPELWKTLSEEANPASVYGLKPKQSDTVEMYREGDPTPYYIPRAEVEDAKADGLQIKR